MTVASKKHNRVNNRTYEWLRCRFVSVLKSQTGSKNSQWQTHWIHNASTGVNKKISRTEVTAYIDSGWKLGRYVTRISNICQTCKSTFISQKRHLKFCSTQCQKTSFKSQLSGRKTELLLLCQTTGSLNKTLKQMGFPGARGVWYRKAKNILDNVGDK